MKKSRFLATISSLTISILVSSVSYGGEGELSAKIYKCSLPTNPYLMQHLKASTFGELKDPEIVIELADESQAAKLKIRRDYQGRKAGTLGLNKDIRFDVLQTIQPEENEYRGGDSVCLGYEWLDRGRRNAYEPRYYTTGKYRACTGQIAPFQATFVASINEGRIYLEFKGSVQKIKVIKDGFWTWNGKSVFSNDGEPILVSETLTCVQ